MAARPRVAQRHLQDLRDNAVDTPAIPESDFVLGRMRVGVHPGRIQRQVQHVSRKAAVEKDIPIRVLRRVRQCPVADAAAVDEPVLLVRLAPVVGRQRNPALQREAFALVLDMDGLVGECVAAQPGKAGQLLFTAGGGGQLEYGATVVRQRKRNPGPRQCKAPQPFFDVPELGPLGSQEAAPCRRVVEQVVDFDRRAVRLSRRPGARNLAAVRLDLPAGILARRARREHQAGHRCNAGQGLAAEPEGHDRLQVLEAANLTGRMPRERQRQFVPVDTGTIVAHADQLRAACSDVDVDIVGTGVEAVLDEFLDDGRGPLDDFAGSDLVDQVAWQLLYGHVD